MFWVQLLEVVKVKSLVVDVRLDTSFAVILYAVIHQISLMLVWIKVEWSTYD